MKKNIAKAELSYITCEHLRARKPKTGQVNLVILKELVAKAADLSVRVTLLAGNSRL